ncbi:MAG: hypothetical protein V1779_09535 [bacterium]
MKTMKLKTVIILIICFNIFVSFGEDIETKKVKVTKKIKLDYPIFTYTDRFPRTFYVTKDEKILINYQVEDTLNYMFLYKADGTLYKKFNLLKFKKICPTFHDRFYRGSLNEGGFVYDQIMFDSTKMYLSGEKFSILNLNKNQIIFESFDAANMHSNTQEDKIFIYNQAFKFIAVFDIKNKYFDTVTALDEYAEFFYTFDNKLLYTFNDDSLKIVSILNNSKIEKLKLFKYKSDNNYELRVLGVNDKNIYINYLDYPDNADNTIIYDSCKHYIHIYDKKQLS